MAYELIEKIEINSLTPLVEFDNIPNTYNSLFLYIYLKLGNGGLDAYANDNTNTSIYNHYQFERGNNPFSLDRTGWEDIGKSVNDIVTHKWFFGPVYNSNSTNFPHVITQFAADDFFGFGTMGGEDVNLTPLNKLTIERGNPNANIQPGTKFYLYGVI